MARFFIIETQHRADGDINFVKAEKYDEGTALSYYHSRVSAYYADTTYTKAAVMVCDASLNVLKQQEVPTKYVAPTTTE